MDDNAVLVHINELVDEEKRLRAGTARSSADRQRLEQIEVELDRYWDLLRQRRAREEYGEDPDTAAQRSSSDVEGYLQ